MNSGSPSLNLPSDGQSSNGGSGTIQTPRVVPLTCHGHSRPVVHLHFSPMVGEEEYYMISACKDNNPMLRDGITGDWIGTFLGHKGAVWQARLSTDATMAVTASADFSAKIWDTFSGECLQTLSHNHIVRSVTFSPSPTHVATGGQEKKLRVFDLSRPDLPLEIGQQVHTGTIKSIVWSDVNTLLSASDDKKLRWWDLRSRDLISQFDVDELVGSCELSAEGNLISATAGKSVYFFEAQTRRLIKSITSPYEVSSVALHQQSRKFITGGSSDTWVRVYDYDTEQELEVYKGHHGSIWSVSFSPDGKLYATGSEDGTIKLWKYTNQTYGLWKQSTVMLWLYRIFTSSGERCEICNYLGTLTEKEMCHCRLGIQPKRINPPCPTSELHQPLHTPHIGIMVAMNIASLQEGLSMLPKSVLELTVPEPENCPGPDSEQAGMMNACTGCPNQNICATASKGPDPDLPLIRARMASVAHKILILSGKGGVGKSTFTSMLAYALAQSPETQVGVCDVDICGPSMPRMMGVNSEQIHTSASGWSPVYVADNLSVMSIQFMLPNQDDAIIWRGPKKNGLIKKFLKEVEWGELDFMLVDTPPGTTDEHLSVSNYLKESGVDGAIIVTTPQEVSLLDVRKEIDFCRKAGIRVLGIVENMSGFICPNCTGESEIFQATTGGARALALEKGLPYLGSVPVDPRIGVACDYGESFFDAYPDSPACNRLINIIKNVQSGLQLSV